MTSEGRPRIALAPGVVGVFIFLPWTLGRLFGGSLGAPVVMMISGFALLAVVALLLRRPRRHRSGEGALAGGRFRVT